MGVEGRGYDDILGIPRSEDSKRFIRGRSCTVVVNGDMDGLLCEMVEDADPLSRIYTSTFRLKTSVGHVVTTQDNKTYTVMPGDSFSMALPLTVVRKDGSVNILTYEIYVKKIKDAVTNARTAATGGISSASGTSWDRPMYMSSFASFDDFRSLGPFPEDPFTGFNARKPKKPTKKEEKETAEELERKLTEYGKRKINMG